MTKTTTIMVSMITHISLTQTLIMNRVKKLGPWPSACSSGFTVDRNWSEQQHSGQRGRYWRTVEQSIVSGQEQEVIKYYQNNPDAMQQLAGPMFEERVDYIRNGKVTDVDITAEQLYAEPTEKDAERMQRRLNLRWKPLQEDCRQKSASKVATNKVTPKKPLQRKRQPKKNGWWCLIRGHSFIYKRILKNCQTWVGSFHLMLKSNGRVLKPIFNAIAPSND